MYFHFFPKRNFIFYLQEEQARRRKKSEGEQKIDGIAFIGVTRKRREKGKRKERYLGYERVSLRKGGKERGNE